MTPQFKQETGKNAVKRMVKTQGSAIDLASLFNVATQALAANKSSLNKADAVNNNHGDNMVQVFNLITQTLASNSQSTPTKQLLAASQALAQNSTSGSTQAYSKGLAQAAQQLKGQPAVTPENAMTLVQALFGGSQGQASSQGMDLLGSLLGGTQTQAAPQGADLLGSLLGGTQAQAGTGQQETGIDAEDLLNAGMAFLNAKQQGANNLQAGLQALVASGPMGQTPHRQQSGELVASTLIQALAGLAAKRK